MEAIGFDAHIEWKIMHQANMSSSNASIRNGHSTMQFLFSNPRLMQCGIYLFKCISGGDGSPPLSCPISNREAWD